MKKKYLVIFKGSYDAVFWLYSFQVLESVNANLLTTALAVITENRYSTQYFGIVTSSVTECERTII